MHIYLSVAVSPEPLQKRNDLIFENHGIKVFTSNLHFSGETLLSDAITALVRSYEMALNQKEIITYDEKGSVFSSKMPEAK